MQVGVAKLPSDDEEAAIMMADIQLLCHADPAVKLDRLLAHEQPSG